MFQQSSFYLQSCVQRARQSTREKSMYSFQYWLFQLNLSPLDGYCPDPIRRRTTRNPLSIVSHIRQLQRQCQMTVPFSQWTELYCLSYQSSLVQTDNVSKFMDCSNHTLFANSDCSRFREFIRRTNVRLDVAAQKQMLIEEFRQKSESGLH